MALLLTILIISLMLGLALTVWLVWRSGKRLAEKEGGGRAFRLKFKLGSSLDLDSMKDVLLAADMGSTLSNQLMDSAKKAASPSQALDILRAELLTILSGDTHLETSGTPAVWLFVGVNGSGKTTSIAKLAHQQIQQKKKVVLAAGDTFRAAAVEQLETLAEKIGAGFVKGQAGGDASAVVFDAVSHAVASNCDLVLIDTAGRLHTNANLMEELKKIKATAKKAGGNVSETLLVIDATTGQNGLTQAREFQSAVDVSGIILTKLDGSTKGGIVACIAHELAIPIKRVGTGERIENIELFNAKEFVESLI